ncbi:uncharacterized protein P174DRAFT_248555 [Aspergillus novofumigatus IBT 16806]|uniref:Uncharacterized protein n=1 Tax=Aspergillus novofumigatus (strain IBT 16806) TaxID=1392255 RepID=A0A2I1C2B6_ASPN1|nr:uncharacterized protein P174DRAFT_248555 [Aspergillus novofumigatus IBT 16806]PKX91774.1 hypothetical protein P174DRAFT_248555 [Aspergillus novofumigatus IBT 16806]
MGCYNSCWNNTNAITKSRGYAFWGLITAGITVTLLAGRACPFQNASYSFSTSILYKEAISHWYQNSGRTYTFASSHLWQSPQRKVLPLNIIREGMQSSLREQEEKGLLLCVCHSIAPMFI